MTSQSKRKNPHRNRNFTVQTKSFQLELGQRTHIMGIVNATPDSFSADGCFDKCTLNPQKVIRHAQRLIKQGADIIDIGGESTRPGAKRITVSEEKERVIPAITALAKKTIIPISIDTYKPTIAKYALDAGACFVNNIMGTHIDKNLLKMVKNYNAGIILMHIQGTPQNMQKNIRYKALIPEIISALKKSIENCLAIGIKSDKLIIDPGIGFGKTVEHNLEIINQLEEFKVLKCPILIGPSRKSFIGKILNTEVQDRLIGTVASVCASIHKGAHIVRVHDVKKIKEAVTMTDAIIHSK